MVAIPTAIPAAPLTKTLGKREGRVTGSFSTAEKLREMLTDEKQSVLSKRGSALADIRSNKLFVMDTPSRLDEVRQMIAQIDIPVRQVLIEARIVEADDRFSRNLGTKLGYYDRRSTIYRTAARTNPVTGETESVNVPAGCAPSLLRGFSAPVRLQYAETPAQLLHRLAHDSDPFNHWEADE